VVSHHKLTGYLLKLYLDKGSKVHDDEKFQNRIIGAIVVRDVIDSYGLHSFFKVPGKWLYPLPFDPSSTNKKGYQTKNFILVVEDMNILEKKENKARWKSSAVTPPLLDALYIILDEAGLWDSTFTFNIPFSKDGKISVIDTEYFNRWPINFKRLGNQMSSEMKEYWLNLISTQE